MLFPITLLLLLSSQFTYKQYPTKSTGHNLEIVASSYRLLNHFTCLTLKKTLEYTLKNTLRLLKQLF